MLQRQLYRSLLRVTKTLDSKPASKTLIYRNQRESFTDGMENDIDLAGNYYVDLLGDLFDNTHFIDPNRCHISLESMLKREYRGLGIGKNVNRLGGRPVELSLENSSSGMNYPQG